MFIGVAIFDHDIPALVIALLVQSLEERIPEIGIERPAIWRKPADKGRRPRLRERRDGPGDKRAAEKSDEIPSLHSITSSASDGSPAHHGVCPSHTATGSGSGATFQVGAKFGVGRCSGIEKPSLISLTRRRGGRGHTSGEHSVGVAEAQASVAFLVENL